MKDTAISDLTASAERAGAEVKTLRERVSALEGEVTTQSAKCAELFSSLAKANSALEAGRQDSASLHQELLSFKDAQRAAERVNR